MNRTENKKPIVQLSGQDGNVFSIIGRVSSALNESGEAEKSKEFVAKAFASESYDAVLQLCIEYCEVE